MKKNIAILGSTGSIGRSTLEVAAAHPDRLEVVALAAGNNVRLLAEQVHRFRPRLVSLTSAETAGALERLLGDTKTKILYGNEGLKAVARFPEAETVVAAIVGAAGLAPSWEAIQAGKDLALANKETLVMAGPLVLEAVREKGVRLLPIDSEHAAIHQSLAGHRRDEIRRIILTASGGPFRTWDRDRIAQATAADALAHPTWRMGPKITIDSATLMNKGLEVIEARWLFDVAPEKIDVLVHTESIVHSMVEYHDGQIMAQMGVPDMKGPIAYALTYPERLRDVVEPLDLIAAGPLHFYPADRDKFPCLDLAYQALGDSELAPAILNAANETAVQAFLQDAIHFNDISKICREVLNICVGGRVENLEAVIQADRRSREIAAQLVERLAREKTF